MSETVDRLLTVAGAAKFLTLAEQTVRNLTSKGRIPVLHIGRRCVYDREALLEWALAQTGPRDRSDPQKNGIRSVQRKSGISSRMR
jgi:excisionase family DNA binding protein